MTPSSVGTGVSASPKSSSDRVPVDALPPAPTGGAALVAPRGVDVHPASDLIDILSAMQATAYAWDLESDAISWQANAGQVLGIRNPALLATGSDFQFLIAPEHVRLRQEAISSVVPDASRTGAHYSTQYRITPGGRRSEISLWIEDHGRCTFDTDGRARSVQGVLRVVDEQQRAEQRLLYRNDHDELTGQLNRTRLTEAISAVLERAERTAQNCAFLIIAIDNLSVINETFGFAVGDEVIAKIAHLIKGRLRSCDTIGRWSSNKFGVILNDCSQSAMRITADRFIATVRDATIEAAGCQLSATLSIGGVMLPEQAHNVNQAVGYALMALDKAKARRQEGFIPYEPNASGESRRRRNISLANDVISALDENRMLLALQPIVSMATREASLYECLLRMERPDGVIVSAGEFIAVAEQIGLSRLIDRRTLELSVDILKKHPDIHLSLNVSGLTASDHDWLITLHKLTGGRRQLLQRLTIEITETSVIDDLDVSISFVDMLRELGCRVAIDDFGAGYTSFKNLKLLRVDMVKIDGSFVRNLLAEPTNRVFIKTLVEIAQTFGLETVAEWVADEPTALLLAEFGITHMQGFLFGQPIMASSLPVA